MAIKIKEKIFVDDTGRLSSSQFKMFTDQTAQLLPGEYSFYVLDSKKNRSLQQGKYLFGVVLKMISTETGYDAKDLYEIFEKMFCPVKVVNFKGEEHIIQDMKRLDTKEMGIVIEKIIRWADVELGVIVPSQEQTKDPLAADFYVDAYNDSWIKK